MAKEKESYIIFAGHNELEQIIFKKYQFSIVRILISNQKST